MLGTLGLRGGNILKIRSIRLEDHPGIGNLTVSFLDEDGNPYSVVVLAGANGTGKTALLEAVYSAMNFEQGPSIGIVHLEIQFTPDEIVNLQIQAPALVMRAPFPEGVVTLRYDSSVIGNYTPAFAFHWASPDGEFLTFPASTDWRFKRALRCLFNEAGVDYRTRAPDSITGLFLDDSRRATSRSSDIAQQISQLLIDIRNADSEEVNIWVEDHEGQPVPSSVKDRRFGRFRSAFAIMWPQKKFRGVRRDGGQMLVEFEEFGRISTIDRLSTGEKQIAFRGGYLLRDRDELGTAVVLVDEPELSLHPDWQRRIVDFYREIVKQPDGSHPQIIIATHSPFIVHGAPGAKVIILEKDATTGAVVESPSPAYPISLESMAVRAFSLEQFIVGASHRTLVMTEGETDATLLRIAWEKLRPNFPIPFEVRAALGAHNISVTLKDGELGSKIGNRQILGLFDFDWEGFGRWNGVFKGSVDTGTEATGLIKKHAGLQAWAMLLPVPAFRAQLASHALGARSMMPIELLFPDAALPPAMLGYTSVAGGAQIPHLLKSKKVAFAERAATYNPDMFSAFEPLLTAIEGVVAQLR